MGVNTRYAIRNSDTYTSSTATAKSGNIYRGETVEFLNQKENGRAYIQYYVTTGGTKNAWVNQNDLGTTRPKVACDPIKTELSYTRQNHGDFAGAGLRVHAMCDGIFDFAYKWEIFNGVKTYVSLGRGIYLVPDAGWEKYDGTVINKIEYGHLASLSGYTTPSYVENRYPSEHTSATVVTPLEKKRVKQGDFIGISGNSGNSTGPHLHIKINP